MKRILTLAVAVAAISAGTAFAQTFPSTTQDNSALISQSGNRHVARIDQVAGGTINGQNRAEIDQGGNRNTADIRQSTAVNPKPLGTGFANTALITQRQADNRASIDQIHDYNTLGLNNADITQATRDSLAEVRQRGDRNSVVLRQRANQTARTAYIDQNGFLNTARVIQESTGGIVRVSQGEFSAGVSSPITTRGNVVVNSSGLNPDIAVSQLGNGHRATVNEDGTNGIIDISMSGAFNTADVIQESTNGIVDIRSQASSSNNFVDVNQVVGDVGSRTYVIQSGRNSVADILQQDDGGLGGNNLAEVIQTGLGGSAGSIVSDVIQDGGNNRTRVTQANATAASVVAQFGLGHIANVSQ